MDKFPPTVQKHCDNVKRSKTKPFFNKEKENM